MSSRFSEFLSQEKIDPRRLLAASRQIERLRPEDRRIKLQKRKGKSADATEADKAKAAQPKPRSGRVITTRLLAQAQAGGTLSGSQKTRLVRALNRVLEQKKRDAVELRKVF
jgi:hypothetical protein